MTEVRPVARVRRTQPGGLHHTLLAVCKLIVHASAKWTHEELEAHGDDLAACELFCSSSREGEEVET